MNFLIILFLFGCHTAPQKKAENSNQYKDEDVKLNEVLQKKIGSWAKEGADCYGLIVLANKNNTVKYGRSVKTTIIRIKSDSIKVKALEEVNLAKVKDCSKLGVTPGFTWWEKDGELFRTREEADNYLKSKDWVQKTKQQGKFKIGD